MLATGDVIEGMAVVAQGTPAMSVVVSAGSARISTGTYPSSYGYFVGIDTTAGTPAGETVTITTASGSNPRIDAIVAYVDLSVTASSATANNPNNMLKVAAVAGTPAGSPTAPSNSTIQAAIGASNPFIKLATVLVGTSVTSISNSNITDTRAFASLTVQNIAAVCEFSAIVPASNGLLGASGFTKAVFTVEQYDTSNNFDNSSTSRFTCTKAGKYHFDSGLNVLTSSGSEVYAISLYVNGAELVRGTQGSSASGAWGGTVSKDVRLQIGDYVEIFGYTSATGTRTINGLISYFSGAWKSL